MAFVTLVDRYAEMECLIFPKVYNTCAHLLINDAALYVQGTISLREEELPKLLVDKIDALVDDESYITPAVPPAQQPEMRSASSQATVSAAPKQETGAVAARQSHAASGYSAARAAEGKLYLRIPEKDSLLWKKAYNLLEIFDGATPVIFYDMATASYQKAPHGVMLSEFVYEQFVSLLGAENVVLK